MDIIKCPKCGKDVEINVANACDEHGEEFICNSCGFPFRYVK